MTEAGGMVSGGSLRATVSAPVAPKTGAGDVVDQNSAVGVLVQGRIGGPVERYRVASPEVCRVAKVLGWSAVACGAAEMAIGVIVFNRWLREGGWWAGILATSLGIVATGINAYTPVGSYLVSWLVWLGLATFLVNLVTLLVLDGALWIDTRDLEACAPTFDEVCAGSSCTCTTDDELWDRCFDVSNCDDIAGSSTTLLASSIALAVLAMVSLLLFALGIKCKYVCGGATKGGKEDRPDSISIPAGARPSYSMETPGAGRGKNQNETPGRIQAIGATLASGDTIITEDGLEEQREPAARAATPLPRWAAKYVDRVAGGRNKSRGDALAAGSRGADRERKQ